MNSKYLVSTSIYTANRSVDFEQPKIQKILNRYDLRRLPSRHAEICRVLGTERNAVRAAIDVSRGGFASDIVGAYVAFQTKTISGVARQVGRNNIWRDGNQIGRLQWNGHMEIAEDWPRDAMSAVLLCLQEHFGELEIASKEYLALSPEERKKYKMHLVAVHHLPDDASPSEISKSLAEINELASKAGLAE